MENKSNSRLFGLIGYKLSHSFSQSYFTKKYACENIVDTRYELFPLEHISALPNLLVQHPNLCGLNVTIPYKEAVIDYLDELDDTAAEIGAVNTILIRKGRLKGYNTDVYGFVTSLKGLLGSRQVESALVLGTGGASKAVAYGLKQLGIRPVFVSRNPSKGDLTYSDINASIIEKHLLVINTTPLGMSPNVETAPSLPYDLFNSHHLLYDLVYNPEKTVFLESGEKRKCSTKNGLEMLHLQAERAWSIWTK